jgi:hypothetical protein
MAGTGAWGDGRREVMSRERSRDEFVTFTTCA